MRRLALIHPETSESVDINLSPLIDMVFLLLIFFMVTTVFVQETGVEVQKPSAATAEQLDRSSIMLALLADGRVVYGGQPVALNGVRALVSRLLADHKVPVVVVADKAAPAGLLVNVIDECKLAGATQVSLAAERR